jgi:hypothetical protein
MNEYLMNQSVITFSNSTARGSAITTPVEGMITYLEDTQTYESWDGSAWVAFGGGASSGNAIINGAFEINQRGFTSSTTGVYGFDRWAYGPSGATGTYSAETFTLGTAPVAGYEARNFARLAVTTGNDLARLQQLIESVRTFAGQTVTVSFFAKGTNPATDGNLAVYFFQNFGTGGSPSAEVAITQQTFVLTSNWTRYSFTFEIPSIAGKTIGTNNNDYLNLGIGQGTSTSTDSWTLDLWGVQIEEGSTATPFRRNANSLQGELAACQRYYQRFTGNVSGFIGGRGNAFSTTQAFIQFALAVPMRTKPASVDFSNLSVYDDFATTTVTSLTLSTNSNNQNAVSQPVVGSGLTQFRSYSIISQGGVSGFIGFSAEL